MVHISLLFVEDIMLIALCDCTPRYTVLYGKTETWGIIILAIHSHSRMEPVRDGGTYRLWRISRGMTRAGSSAPLTPLLSLFGEEIEFGMSNYRDLLDEPEITMSFLIYGDSSREQ